MFSILRTECVLSSENCMSFPNKLAAKKEELKLTQKQMCEVLYDVPHRTLQSWLQGEKAPPDYVIDLIFFRLDNIEDS